MRPPPSGLALGTQRRGVVPPDPPLSFRNVTKTYAARRGAVSAVQGVSFDLLPGRALGIVGQSGSGKSTIASLIVRAEKPTSGEVLFEGGDLAGLAGERLRRFRRRVQMVFQDPFGSLNPRFSVGFTVTEPLTIHGLGSRAERRDRAAAALEEAELRPGADFLDRLPHQLSGGQRQRVAIARALVLEPAVLVADEPVSMLDVSARAGIVTLLRRLVEARGLALAFITHDLATVGAVCDEVAVMREGVFVERAATAELIGAPSHPYTQALIAAVPRIPALDALQEAKL
jgi:ABC-type glutathione transport system ATPase component